MGQKYEASLAFLVENISSLLHLSMFTLFKFHYNSIKQTQNQLAFTPFHTHKITKKSKKEKLTKNLLKPRLENRWKPPRSFPKLVGRDKDADFSTT